MASFLLRGRFFAGGRGVTRICLFLVFIVPCAAYATAVAVGTDPNLAIGAGFDSVANRVRGDCVVRTDPEPDKGAPGQLSQIFNLLEVESYQSLAEKLDIGGSGTFSLAGGSVNGKAQLARSFEMNQYSLYALVTVRVENEKKRMRGVQLVKPYWWDLMKNDPQLFHEKCGNEFVVGSITGGEYDAVIEVKTSSSQERNDLSASLGGAFGSFSGAADFNNSLQKIAKDHLVHIYSFQTGGNGEVIATTPDAMIKKATEFPGVVKNSGVVFLYSTLDYDQLELPVGATPFDITNKKKVITYISEAAAASERLLADIDYITRYPKEFHNADLKKLSDDSSVIRAQLNILDTAVSDCYKKILACKYPEQFKLPLVSLPERVKTAEETCKTPIYRQMKDPQCGAAQYNEARGEPCGPEIFREGTAPICGADVFKEKEDPACGALLYRSAPNPACGVHPGLHEPGIFGQGMDEECRRLGYPLGSDGYSCHVANTCRDPSNGVERYKSCRLPAFGVERYKTCRDASFGVERYQTCRNPAFGIADYAVCARKEFGFDRCAD